MLDLTKFLDRCDNLAHVSGLSRATISTKILAGSTRLADLRTGSDIGVRRLARAYLVLADLERKYHVPVTEVAALAPTILTTPSFATPDTSHGYGALQTRTAAPVSGRLTSEFATPTVEAAQ